MKVLSFAIMFVLLASIFGPAASVIGAAAASQGDSVQATNITSTAPPAPSNDRPVQVTPPSSSALTLAGPIIITSDADLEAFAAQYGFPGNGSADNPFLLDNIQITFGYYAYGTVVFIEDTTEHFVLSNGTFSEGKYASPDNIGAGILLSNVQNATIDNCYLSNDYVSIKAIDSSNVTIRSVHTSSNYATDVCVDLENCNHTILRDSSIPSDYTDSFSMKMVHSSNCTVENNSFGCRSTQVQFSDHNQFLNNTWSSMYDYGLDIRSSDSNLVQGNVFHDASYNDINSLDCTNNSYLDNILENSWMGIYLLNSPCAVICGNNFSGSNNCIFISAGGNDLIYNNTIMTSVEGIRLDGVHDEMVLGNRISDCGYAAIELSGSPNVHLQIYNNTLIHDSIFTPYTGSIGLSPYDIPTNNTVNGGPVYFYKDMDATGTSVPLNAGEVILTNTTGLQIHDLNLTKQNFGIVALFSSGLLIKDNTLSGMDQIGMSIVDGSNEMIQNNTLTDFNNGIYMSGVDSSQILLNNLTDCYNLGMRLSACNQVKVPGKCHRSVCERRHRSGLVG